jgi:small subunit ribosomal protein S20
MLTVAHSLSSKKRIRQNETRRTINKLRAGVLKAQTRRFTDAVVAKDPTAAEAEFRKLTKTIDQTCAKGIIHKNQGARRKSRMQKQLSAIKSAG